MSPAAAAVDTLSRVLNSNNRGPHLGHTVTITHVRPRDTWHCFRVAPGNLFPILGTKRSSGSTAAATGVAHGDSQHQHPGHRTSSYLPCAVLCNLCLLTNICDSECGVKSDLIVFLISWPPVSLSRGQEPGARRPPRDAIRARAGCQWCQWCQWCQGGKLSPVLRPVAAPGPEIWLRYERSCDQIADP